MATKRQFEVFHETNGKPSGHCGPFWKVEDAVSYATRYLSGFLPGNSRKETVVDVTNGFALENREVICIVERNANE